MGRASIRNTTLKVFKLFIAFVLCVGVLPMFSQASAYADEEKVLGSEELPQAEEGLDSGSPLEAEGELDISSELEKSPDAEDVENLSELAAAPNAEADGSYSYLPEEALTEDEVTASLQEEDATEDGMLALSADASTLAKKTIIPIEGSDRYITSIKQAQYSYKTSDTVIIASGTGYSDSLSATSLAGAINCPILLSPKDSLPQVTKDALSKLGVKKVIIVGSTNVISAKVANQLKSYGSVERLAGPTRFETQMEIYNYGVKKGYWTGDTIVVATGMNFPDALAVSPVSFALKAPVFFVDSAGNFPTAQQEALAMNVKIKRVLITGSEVVVSAKAEDFVKTLVRDNGGNSSNAVRLGGLNRFSTSVKIAEYAVSNLGFKWDSVAFATGQAPYDALGGGVVQGRQKSVLLLADGVSTSAAEAASKYKSSITTNIKFFGSVAAIPASARVQVCAYLGIDSGYSISSTYYPISRMTMAQYQVNRNEGYGATKAQFYDALDPFKYPYGDSRFYQHAILTNGYSGVSATSLNSIISSKCVSNEASYGGKSALRNTGQYFIDAAKTYGVNEVYLLSNAALESAWGCSQLARGWTPTKNGTVVVSGKSYPYYKGVTYYNFFGIGAVDSNALAGGQAKAVVEGWTTPEKAIKGAAKWISTNYLKRSDPAPQNTLYLMKWDVPYAAKYGSAWHEYCTGMTWQTSIASIMGDIYSSAGINMASSGLKFNVPAYAS